VEIFAGIVKERVIKFQKHAKAGRGKQMEEVVHLAWERQARNYHHDQEVWPFIPCFLSDPLKTP